uniref:Uncharacterized protein n=1 Tax=Aureoumbra lagunensis TaxID=44058 RepID=A0A7S3JUS7_9STRA|mmetsp:Transcript_9201/g.14180  ORF Transcript_9201/g.14180 Transcript_9201/m.14180 type:complete len:154 (-) Transcript_9201:207-668(-)
MSKPSRSPVTEALENDIVMKDLEEKLQAAKIEGERLKKEAEAVHPVTPPTVAHPIFHDEDELTPSLADLNAILDQYINRVEIDDEGLRKREHARLVARTKLEFQKRRAPAINQARHAARYMLHQDRKRAAIQRFEEDDDPPPPLCSCSFIWRR